MVDSHGNEYAKISQLMPGQKIWHDGGSPCWRGHWSRLRYEDGFYFPCRRGRHYLSGQADNGEDCVGIYVCKPVYRRIEP